MTGTKHMTQLKSAIYQIVCNTNNKVYIGSSVNPLERFRKHKEALKRGKHHSIYLQKMFNKYGIDSLEFSILEHCEPEYLLDVEQDYINYIDHSVLINIAKIDITRPFLGKKLSDDLKAEMSKNMKGELNRCYGLKGDQHPAYGHKHTKETRKKLSDRQKLNPTGSGGLKGDQHPSAKSYRVVDPDGNEQIIKGLNQFCKANGLNVSTMCDVAKGRRYKHKGWNCYHY